MDVVLIPLLQVVVVAIDLYIWVVIAGVVMSWLTAFNVVNTSNRAVYMIGDFIYRVTEPPLRRIRRFMPDLGAIDLSPILLLLGLMFLQNVLTRVVYSIV
ncbi:MAG: YggT family protein [Alphaproteobacteria bacterium]|nr:YggT family protein [Alphaproteobacteria bacterium]MBF0251188.1 YggT family protein [Alphaproteobacteria bacterium]